MMKFKPLLLILPVVFGCGRSAESEPDATNEFEGRTLTYWYETYSLTPGEERNFQDLYRKNADLLLARDADHVPETLKGLWYMDGNPVSDQTLSLARAIPVQRETGDLTWPINTPLTFSWINTAKSHETIQGIMLSGGEYEVKFHDCPDDVVAERRALGAAEPGCTAADREYAIITPFINVGGWRQAIPLSVAHFDMYLRPQAPGTDYLVWERRSALLRPVKSILGRLGITEAAEDAFSRYSFTQILDKEGNRLQYWNKFEQDMDALAAENDLDRDELLIHLCYDGIDGCERRDIIENRSPESRRQAAFELLKNPLF